MNTPVQLAPNLHQLSLGMVNVFLIEHEDELVLIDTGVPGSEILILDGVRALGRQPQQVRHIIVTHFHPDHAGSLAALKELTGATTYMHPLDARIVREGLWRERAVMPAPGFEEMFAQVVMAPQAFPRTAVVDVEVLPGEVLPIAGGLKVLHAPGHSAGQIALLWSEHGGVLFAADAMGNMRGLHDPILFEDLEAGRGTQRALAALAFEVATFGHGDAIREGASRVIRERWGAPGAVPEA
ncbi:MBL fold metallo-hydrolase [Deinococcus yavapaiensis]|uniref:Glyoxylase-like metal-dependent hydrolase (Beta-lactamase superfamily II) n=1 Tax=Deinococcus yavapaiensis KR-236 TaxID=694435 RepID=A0A318S327_9DEIO|nr:MBL fold metallo-hydrolase [Deinococcus yavapaiensis]PYE51825.1 glyoxylase-like metal-dependent hydrolase (beta-lactamase superfamily II) [Deinococcus yavapaiensis KR-236]